eukprot:9149732-Prorocentrum_lima.AAC.1
MSTWLNALKRQREDREESSGDPMAARALKRRHTHPSTRSCLLPSLAAISARGKLREIDLVL